jgi:sec-independent protein translocase protein TatA
MGLDNPLHIAFLLFVVLLVFGAKRLPELGRSLGSGLRGFKEAVGGLDAHTQLPSPAQLHAPAAAVAPELAPAIAPATAIDARPPVAAAPAGEVTALPAVSEPVSEPMPPAA